MLCQRGVIAPSVVLARLAVLRKGHIDNGDFRRREQRRRGWAVDAKKWRQEQTHANRCESTAGRRAGALRKPARRRRLNEKVSLVAGGDGRRRNVHRRRQV